MSRPAISGEGLSEHFHISEHPQGFWLYDEIIGMNLAMGAETREKALLEGLFYYQEKLLEVKTEYKKLVSQVDAFISQVRPPEGDYDD